MGPIWMTLLLVSTLGFFSWSAFRRLRQVSVGVPDPRFSWSGDQIVDRTKTLLVYAFGQKKMPNYSLAGFAHVGIFVAFQVLGLEHNRSRVGDHHVKRDVGGSFVIVGDRDGDRDRRTAKSTNHLGGVPFHSKSDRSTTALGANGGVAPARKMPDIPSSKRLALGANASTSTNHLRCGEVLAKHPQYCEDEYAHAHAHDHEEVTVEIVLRKEELPEEELWTEDHERITDRPFRPRPATGPEATRCGRRSSTGRCWSGTARRGLAWPGACVPPSARPTRTTGSSPPSRRSIARWIESAASCHWPLRYWASAR